MNDHEHDHRLHALMSAKLEQGAYVSSDSEDERVAQYSRMKLLYDTEMAALIGAAHAVSMTPGTFTLFASEHSCGFKAALVLVCEEAGDCDEPD